ncbi:hypothetical protein GOBAR_DD06265 [Gossypium barbadense]|nr:hypothetical protein GOBAR_DD06265 [Gossypium barbadense]
MDGRRYSFLLVALALVFISMGASLAQGQGKAGNNKKAPYDAASTHYEVLKPSKKGQEKFLCLARGACNGKHLTCPSQCPERKPKKNKKNKGCFVDCSSKCEVTCKFAFQGGNRTVMDMGLSATIQGLWVVMELCFTSTEPREGTSPLFRTITFKSMRTLLEPAPKEGLGSRDYTWVQALAVMFDRHTLVLAAKRVSQWDDSFEALIVRWDGEEVNVPTDGDAEWRATDSDEREVVIERTDETNGVKVTVAGLVELNVKVRAIGEEENKVHNYQLPANDAFAHLETQFKFTNLTDLVEGVLGKTYQPDYISPVKRGVPMPMMGGEDNYQTPSLYSPVCKACKFKGQVDFASI